MSADYTLYLGSKNFSSWSLRPWLAMKMAGLVFDEVVVPLYTAETRPRILAFSPTGKVPALKIAEQGQSYVVWDSLAICETIADRHPEAQLWPDEPRERAEARSIVSEMHSGFPDLRKAMSMDLAKRYPTPEMDDALHAQVSRIIAMWEGALRRHQGGFLYGRFSIADAFYAPVATRFETYSVPLPAVAQAYTQRVLALPAMREWTASARSEHETRDYAARQV
jgi:glutathione S-transferase